MGGIPTPEQARVYRERAYKKARNNPTIWAARLRKQRLRYAKFGHKKFQSYCIACGKKWMGTARPRRFCSQKCVATGIYNGRWDGGRYINKQGYVLVWTPNRERSSRYVLEHRVFMEKALGRKLVPGEEIHHRNGIKTDNRITNLQLVGKAEHARIHAALNRLKRANSVTVSKDA